MATDVASVVLSPPILAATIGAIVTFIVAMIANRRGSRKEDIARRRQAVTDAVAQLLPLFRAVSDIRPPVSEDQPDTDSDTEDALRLADDLQRRLTDIVAPLYIIGNQRMVESISFYQDRLQEFSSAHRHPDPEFEDNITKRPAWQTIARLREALTERANLIVESARYTVQHAGRRPPYVYASIALALLGVFIISASLAANVISLVLYQHAVLFPNASLLQQSLFIVAPVSVGGGLVLWSAQLREHYSSKVYAAAPQSTYR